MRVVGMNMRQQLFLMSMLILLCLIGARSVKAEDVLIRHRAEAGVRQRFDFSEMVLKEAMARTRTKFGPSRVEQLTVNLVRERLLLELLTGEKVNVAIVASQPSWEAQLLPIWIPVDMGLANYRIALTHRNAQARLSAVRALDDLKALRAGVGAGWSSRKVLDHHGFNVALGESFEPLLKMLMAERIDYFPRGINEVFVEYDARVAANPDLAIERDLVIEFPLPGYIFVSPKAPRLHHRLTEGLESMVRDGTLLKMVMNYHAEMIKRANFCERRVFHIENPFLSDKTPLQRKELWFNPYDPKTGVCLVSTQKKPR